jgi:hypothetical protein
VPCCKTNFTEDWRLYWFYVKVDMSSIPGYEGPAYPLSMPIEALTAVCTAPYNHWAARIRNCENAFHLASTILGGRDIIEEFTVARIWPIFMVGPQPKSRTLTSTGRHKKFLSQDSAFN